MLLLTAMRWASHWEQSSGSLWMIRNQKCHWHGVHGVLEEVCWLPADSWRAAAEKVLLPALPAGEKLS